MAAIADDTEAEGFGRRWALWVQGCSLRCAGCCNPEMFAAERGSPVEPAALGARIEAAAARGVEGITVLGGEPFEQPEGVLALARAARRCGLTVMVFSGYTLAELRARASGAGAGAAAGAAIAALLGGAIDVLVDGRYDASQPEPPPPVGRRWLGSRNQVMHFLTAAYAGDDARLWSANTVELRLEGGRLLVNGWPAGADALARLARHRVAR